MSNKKDLNLSIFEFATQFKLLTGFIIAHEYDLRRHLISATYRHRTGTFHQFSRDFGCHTAISR